METEYRLPKDFADKWLAALRSKKYKQTICNLYDDKEDGYCCLGVAAITAGLDKREISGWGFLQGREFEDAGIPKELLGSTQSELSGCLAGLNDAYGYSFGEIADWVENNVELY